MRVNRNKEALLSSEVLRGWLHYDPNTGLFTRIVGCGKGAAVGDVAGTLTKNGYVIISVHCLRFMAQRLAFLYMTGNWPTGIVDHKNGCKSDNKWDNLRDATKVLNAGNAQPHADSTTGIKGVFMAPGGKFRSAIGRNGRQVHLGTFPTIEDAHQAYIKAAGDYFGEYARFE